jgi:hypothetical protein
MARILDFYAVRWAYEPHTFPIRWNLDGDVVESFSPDFWLPDLGLYLEMTTLKQRLVRKKNRKLRRLRELYPDLRIKLFYARDFRALMLKYGKFALLGGLSGTSGQVLPPRALTDADADEVVDVGVALGIDLDDVAPVVEPEPAVESERAAAGSELFDPTPAPAIPTGPATPAGLGGARRSARRSRRSARNVRRREAGR